MSGKKASQALLDSKNVFLSGGSNQPPAELKKLGWAKKKLLKEVLAFQLPNPDDPRTTLSESEQSKLISLASTFGITVDELTIQLAMDLTMAKEAIFNKNVAAYIALTNRAYGMPKVHLESESKNMKLVHVQVTFDDKPPIQQAEIVK